MRKNRECRSVRVCVSSACLRACVCACVSASASAARVRERASQREPEREQSRAARRACFCFRLSKEKKKTTNKKYFEIVNWNRNLKCYGNWNLCENWFERELFVCQKCLRAYSLHSHSSLSPIISASNRRCSRNEKGKCEGGKKKRRSAAPAYYQLCANIGLSLLLQQQ